MSMSFRNTHVHVATRWSKDFVIMLQLLVIENTYEMKNDQEARVNLLLIAWVIRFLLSIIWS